MFRPMRRFGQQLPEDDCKKLLLTAPRGVLSVLGDEGYPYGVPMDFVYADDKIFFHTALSGHKLDAINAYEKASFCVLDAGEKPDDDWAYYFNSIILFGRIHVVDDEEEKLLRLRQLGMKYFPTVEEVDEDIRNNAARCHILSMSIEHMTGKRVHER